MSHVKTSDEAQNDKVAFSDEESSNGEDSYGEQSVEDELSDSPREHHINDLMRQLLIDIDGENSNGLSMHYFSSDADETLEASYKKTGEELKNKRPSKKTNSKSESLLPKEVREEVYKFKRPDMLRNEKQDANRKEMNEKFDYRKYRLDRKDKVIDVKPKTGQLKKMEKKPIAKKAIKMPAAVDKTKKTAAINTQAVKVPAITMKPTSKQNANASKTNLGAANRKNFAKERIHELARQHDIMHRKIISQRPTHEDLVRAAAKSQKLAAKFPAPVPIRQPSDFEVNRKKQQRQIELDNALLKRRIQAIGGRSRQL